ncbi:MAG TPA: glycerol kinase GlpK [Haliangiales bacterium]|nr:glycerol kinase GlpK [Haliangiales bacterium]
MRTVVAIDQGTTGSTVLVLDEKLALLGKANREFPQIYPQPGWVEHDPEQIWGSVLAALRDALAEAHVPRDSVAAVGVTNQRETSLLWDKRTGEPARSAIVWQDRRTAGMCEELKQKGHEPRVRELTGLVLDPYFSGTKLRWMLDDGHRAGAEAGTLAFGTVDSFLVHRLTGGRVHITDPSNASRTLLFGLRSLAWEDELLALLAVPRACLPEVRGSAEVYGTTRGVAGLPDGIPVAGIAGDQQAALFGQACFSPGDAKCTFGTGAFLLLNTGAQPVASRHGLLTTVAWRIGDEVAYALEGSAFIAGAVVQWLRDGLGIIRSAAEVEVLAASVPDSGGVVLVPALAGLGAPHWRPHARGIIAGLTRGSTAAHVARAALEGVALQNVDILRAMEADGGNLALLKVDGGAAANDLLMQFQADVLGVPISRPSILETTALGAAFLAGLGAGVWESKQEILGTWRENRRFLPRIDATEREAHLARWHTAVEKT